MTKSAFFWRDWRGLMSALSLATTALFVLPAAAQAPKVALAVYSNVCFSKGSGDTRGSLIFLLSRSDEFDVLYEETDGWPQRPVLGIAEVKDRALRFEVTTRFGTRLTFSGTITPDEIAGTFSGKPDVLHWKRRPADHSYAEDCK